MTLSRIAGRIRAASAGLFVALAAGAVLWPAALRAQDAETPLLPPLSDDVKNLTLLSVSSSPKIASVV